MVKLWIDGEIFEGLLSGVTSEMMVFIPESLFWKYIRNTNDKNNVAFNL